MIELFVVAAVGFWLGWRASHWLLQSAFNRVMEALGITAEQMRAAIRKSAKEEGIDLNDILDDEPEAADEKPTLEIKVEQVGDRLMAYRADDDFFVAQGQDAAALIDVILNKYPLGHTVKIVEGGELVNDHLEYLKQNG